MRFVPGKVTQHRFAGEDNRLLVGPNHLLVEPFGFVGWLWDCTVTGVNPDLEATVDD